VNPDITWLKDDSGADTADLPDPDVMIGEIFEDVAMGLLRLPAKTDNDARHYP
jgi:hypothetical protein